MFSRELHLEIIPDMVQDCLNAVIFLKETIDEMQCSLSGFQESMLNYKLNFAQAT